MMLPPVVTEALERMTAEAREAGYKAGFEVGRLESRDAGYRDGYAAGRREEKEAWQAALARLLKQDGRGGDAGCAAVPTGRPAPTPVAAGPSPQEPPHVAAAEPAADAAPEPVPLSAQPAPKAPRAGASRGTHVGYRTEERRAVLVRDYPAGRPAREIFNALNAMPGPPVPTIDRLSTWAHQLGLRRPGGWVPGVAIAAGQRAARAARAAVAAGGSSWDEALAWAVTVDPDLVLRGSPADRLAQINELRALEGLKPFVLREQT